MLRSLFPILQPTAWAALLFGTVLSGLLPGQTIAQEADAPTSERSDAAEIATPVPTTPEQVATWITQLDADRFDVRQHAQQQLETAGESALLAVAEVARDGSLESSTRAINILLNWAESPDQALRLATLEQMVNLPNRPREAAMATRLLAEVREQAALEEIEKLGGKVTQTGGYSSLEIVLDKQWKGGDDGLKLLAEVHRPASLALRVTPISEAAIVEHVGKMPQPYAVTIYGIPFAEEAQAKLQKQLPNTLIDAKNGPMLGILGTKTDLIKDSVGVTDVVENGAAHKAGILPGDRITHLDGEKLTDFESLTTRIGNGTYEPGDEAKLTLLRKGETKEVTVKFDRWGATDNTKLLLQKRSNIQRQLPVQGGRILIQGRPIQIQGGQIQGAPLPGAPIRVPRR